MRESHRNAWREGWRGGDRDGGEGSQRNVPLTNDGWQRQKSDRLLPANGTKPRPFAFPFQESKVQRTSTGKSLKNKKRELIPQHDSVQN